MALSRHGNFHSQERPPTEPGGGPVPPARAPRPPPSPPGEKQADVQDKRSRTTRRPGPSPPASVAHRAFPRRRGGPSLLPPAGMLCCHMFIGDKRTWSARTSYEQTSDGTKMEARAGGPASWNLRRWERSPGAGLADTEAPIWPPTAAGLHFPSHTGE